MSIDARSVKQVTAVLLTANEIEKRVVLEAMEPMDGMDQFQIAIGEETSYEIGTLGIYKVAHVHCKNQGNLYSGSILTAYTAMKELNAIMCIMIGVAFGAHKNEQKIGDVIISAAVQPYECLRIGTNNQEIMIMDRNRIAKPGNKIANIFKNVRLDKIDFNIYYGYILSGEKLIDNEEYKKELIMRFHNNEIVGGEMEGVGLASALKQMDNENWMIIKGICDWADGHKSTNKQKRQSLAAEHAIFFCKRIFEMDYLKMNFGAEPVKRIELIKEPINPYVLYYYRNKKMISLKMLSNLTGISEDLLRECEKNPNRIIKLDCNKIKDIRNYLDCGEELTNLKSKKRKIEKFYHRFKGHKHFYPVNNSKVVVFDFDGTLTRTRDNYSSWQLVWEYLGYSIDLCDALYRQYKNGDFDHQGWCDETAKYFCERNLRAEHMDEIAKDIEWVEGAIETLIEIKEKGVKLYICSGAMKDLINIKLGDYRYLFDDIQCNEFTYNRDGYFNGIKGTQFDFEGKRFFIEKVIKDNKISPDECMFIGNSDNDLWAHESGAKTLVVNPHNINGMDRKEWKYYIGKIKNFHEVIPFIFPEDEY